MAGVKHQIEFEKGINWMLRSGELSRKMSVEYHSENSKCLIAKEPIEAGEVLMFVPNHKLMTLERFLKWPSGFEIIKNKL